ncbi:MAG: heavy metal translocating P-type ATPase, partial [Clostridia bacterium]|nr:heavy metal translocating P-type ATPase [Clostridia bacterium]
LVILMYFTMGHMIGLPMPGWYMGKENALVATLLQFLLTLPPVFLNRAYFSRGFKSLYHKAPNMDSLIAVGSGASIVYGVFALFSIGYAMGHGDWNTVELYRKNLYFESAAMILTLITIGKFLEARAKGKTGDAIRKLMDLSPKTACVRRNGNEVTVPIEDVRLGEIVVVRSGENIPVDGTVISGRGSVDQSALTGESVPIEKIPDDTVAAATINLEGYLEIRVEKTGEDTTLSQVIRLVEEAGGSKAPIARLADKIAGIFVPAVMGISLITLVVWLLVGKPFDFALTNAISVLVISCPCALGLATPVAIMVGNGVGAKNGILFKTAVSLEKTGKAQIAALDKTGTITVGKPQVTDIITIGGKSETELLSLACSLEKKSEHPLAQAITKKAEECGVTPQEVDEFKIFPGNGLTATLNGEALLGGNYKFISEKIKVPDEIKSKSEELSMKGKTPLFFAYKDELLGIIAVADIIKEDSPKAIKELQSMGIHVVMLTGDNERTAKAIGERAGVNEVIADVLPDGKESVIRSLKQKGNVIMVGDGINDAPALTSADIGIAIGAGSDIAIDAADVVLMKSNLSDIPAAIRLSRATLKSIHENLFWAFIYNTIGIPLAAGVFINILGWQLSPMFGAAAMSLSSFCVVTNALRLNFCKIYDSNRDHKINNKLKFRKETKAMKKTLTITGMMCEHCEMHTKKALEALDGVTSANVSHKTGTATVTMDKDIPDVVLSKAVTDQGYEVTNIQ